MLTFLIALLAAFFLWEIAVIKVNLRLDATTRKRLFKAGGRFAIVALLVEFTESLVPQSGLSPAAHAAGHALLMAAIPEEFIKFLAVLRFGKRELNATGPGIAVLLAVGTSLGFGVLESQFASQGGDWMLRALAALPMDAIFGFTMGSFMTFAWRVPGKTDETMLLLALLVPTAFHFLFTFLLILHGLEPSLLWPLAALPAAMLLEGGFALILTNHAVNRLADPPAPRRPVDPAGRRAFQFAGISLVLTLTALVMAAEHADLRALAPCAALPLLFTLDLGLVALARAKGYT
ncbi:PrsW family glutamic-type intramembrane protease [Acidocella sp.]|uniref:PrsW family glutamic-type intramembrane protease n=1 Tax=Acidocella sp. TaxID=50710 RepID=UPI003D08FD18